jgi:hypothetical protein
VRLGLHAFEGTVSPALLDNVLGKVSLGDFVGTPRTHSLTRDGAVRHWT